MGIPWRPAAAVLCAMILLIGPPARCCNGPAGEEGAAARSAAADLVAAHGDWCRDHSWRSFARRPYEDALRVEPGNAAASAGLESLRAPVKAKEPPTPPKAGTPPPAVPTVAEVAAREEAAYGAAASRLAEVAAARVAGGDAPGTAEAWRTVLSLDPSHNGARAALALGKAETGWLKTDVDGPSAAMARFADLAGKGDERLPPPAESEEHGGWSEGDATYSRSEEPRFQVKSYDARVSARGLLKDMLRTEALFEGLGVVPARPKRPAPLAFNHVQGKAAYHRAIDGRKDKDEAWKRQARAFASTWWDDKTLFHWSDTPAHTRSSAVHNVAHFLLEEESVGDSAHWLFEGAGFVASTVVCGTSTSTCVTPRVSTFPRDLTRLVDWDEEARSLVQSGDDPDLSGMVGAERNSLTVPALIKSRSLVSWLLATSPLAVKRMAAAAGHAPSPENLILRVLGAPPEAVDRRWRLWALRP